MLLIACLWMISSCTVHNEIHVSPKGDDTFNGTVDKPFKSLQRAYDQLINQMIGIDEGILTVILHDGTYEIVESLNFAEDFPTKEKVTVEWKAAEGAHPIISGAFTILQNASEEKCTIDFPRADGLFDLYVDEKRATRARTPNTGFSTFEKVEEEILERGDGRVPLKAQQTFNLSKDIVKLLSGLNDEELKKVRFNAFFKWDNTIRYLSGKGKTDQSYTTIGSGMKPWNKMKEGTRFYLENYRAALDTSGEWIASYDKINPGLIYIPKENERGNEIKISVPIAEKLLVIKGAPGHKIRNITFEGISFQYSNYELPESGFEPKQAAATIGAAVEIDHAENIVFKNCEIAHTGQYAVWFRKGVKDCEMSQCHLHDLGAGGVRIGETAIPSDSLESTGDILIENCIIQSGGYNFPSAVGVWIGHSGSNKILHNDIADFRYSGVSVGWVWGYADSPAKNNKINFNRIHHIGWALLSDMAGVYTLGQSEGTEVSNNVIHDIHAYSYGGWGLYPDEGSSYIKMENNLVFNTKTGGFHQHYGKENIIRNNILAFADMYQAQATRPEEHLSFTFKNNIILGEEGAMLTGQWKKMILEIDSNCYWMAGDKPYDFAGSGFEEWQQETGHDIHSIVMDPGTIDHKNGVFNLNEGVAEKIGFQVFDPNKAGVFGDPAWKQKAILPDAIVREFKQEVEANLIMNPSR